VKTLSYAEVAGKGGSQIDFDQVSIERATEYAAEDADITLQLHQVQLPKIAENHGLDFV
jgi:DNA polymerase-1